MEGESTPQPGRLIRLLGRVLPGSRFAAGVSWIAGGTVVAQLIGLAASPAITRLYDPSTFGAFAAYMAVFGTLLTISTGRYHLAIVLPKTEREAAEVLRVALGFVLLVSSVVLAMALTIGDQVASLLRAPSVEPYLWFVALGLLFAGTAQSLQTWAVRIRAYSAPSLSRIGDSSGRAVTQIAGGLALPGALIGLPLGDVIGRGLGALVMAARVKKADWPFRHRVTLAKLWTVASRYRRFPLYGMPGGLFNTAGGRTAAPLLLSSLYSLEVAGLFLLCQRVITLPAVFVGQAIAQVFLAEGGRLSTEDPKRLRRLYYKTVSRLVLLAIVPAGTLAAAGPWLFSLVFGAEWSEAGFYARILALMFVAQFSVTPISSMLSLLERQGLQFAWETLRLLGVVLAIWLPAQYGLSATSAIVSFGGCMIVSYVALFVLGAWALRTRIRGLDRAAGEVLGGGSEKPEE